jgi:hypothetical protein
MLVASLLIVALLGLGCGGDDGQEPQLNCVENLPSDCTAAFNANWNNVYENVMQGCSGSGVSCHASEGKQGGLELSSSAIALAELLGESDGKPRVIPFDPACSVLMERLESNDPAEWMPRGDEKLKDGIRCGVQQWIAQGALP